MTLLRQFKTKTMQQATLFLLFFLSCWTHVFATHNRGGVIEYTAMGNGQYEVRVITYTKISPPSNQADRPDLAVNWGDGSPETIVQRTSTTTVAPDVQRNIYTGTHTYNNGTYLISMSDPNRNDGIQNINGGNSIGISFYLEATIVVNGTNNSSVRYLGPAVIYGTIGIPLRFQGMGYDTDGDVICYDLVTPKQSRTTNVMGYQDITDIAPGVNNLYTFDASNGYLVWESPQLVGQYSVAIRAREYRNGVYMGATIMDVQIVIGSGAVMPQPNWTLSGPIRDTLAPGMPFSISAAYADAQSNAVRLEAFSETLESGAASTTNFPQGNSKDSLTYQWMPTAADVRCAPYIDTLKGSATYSSELSDHIVVQLYIRDGTPNNCDSLLNCAQFNSVRRTQNADLAVRVWPNPLGEYGVFELGTVPSGAVRLLVFDATGKLLEQRQFEGNRYTYDTEALPAGLYFYRLQLEDGRFQTGKLIRQ